MYRVNVAEDKSLNDYLKLMKEGRVTRINLYSQRSRTGRRLLEDNAAHRLVVALRKNNTVTELILYRNAITDAGVIELCNVLREHEAIQKIDLRKNRLTNAGADALLRLLAAKPALKIEISPTNIDEDKFRRIHYQHRAATRIQAMTRGFFARGRYQEMRAHPQSQPQPQISLEELAATVNGLILAGDIAGAREQLDQYEASSQATETTELEAGLAGLSLSK